MANRDGPDDEQTLVVAAQMGDGAAFGALVRRHQRRAYAVCRAILIGHEDAEDAVQEGFLNAFRSLERFDPRQPFGGWLHRIMANAALDLRRRRKVRETDILSDSVPCQLAAPGDRLDWSQQLGVAMSRLSPRQRAVVVLHEVEGFTHAEIAGMLGIAEGTAKSDLHFARGVLRRSLSAVREDLLW